MQSWAEFDRLENEHYNAMFDEYNRGYEDEDAEKEYYISWTYKGSAYEFDYHAYGENEGEAECDFWDSVARGYIQKFVPKDTMDNLPKDINDFEILDIWEVA